MIKKTSNIWFNWCSNKVDDNKWTEGLAWLTFEIFQWETFWYTFFLFSCVISVMISIQVSSSYHSLELSSNCQATISAELIAVNDSDWRRVTAQPPLKRQTHTYIGKVINSKQLGAFKTEQQSILNLRNHKAHFHMQVGQILL